MTDLNGGAETQDRRRFLQAVIRASTAVIGLVTVIPGVGMLLAPIIGGGAKQRKKILFAQPSDAESASYVAARLEGQEETAPGIFVRKAEGRVQVVSAKCPHAGCAVSWKSDKNEFFCPCHAGRFDDTGKVLAGPPPRALDRLATQTVNGELYVEEPEA
jgi:Rieske Fe-S protein